MNKTFKVLSQDEQDDIIVEFYEAQERDLFSHELNAERYERMLAALPDGDWRKRIEQLHTETLKRKDEVESILAATESQLPPADRIAASLARIAAKRGKVA